jgi:predicted kinase
VKLFPFPAPESPDWQVDWPALSGEFDWIAAMRDCPQNPEFHAEGDVWTHVGMVCRALAGLDEYRALPEFDRDVLFAAALLHDVAKPSCTRYEDGRITSRGHSPRGAVDSRRILWEMGVDFRTREQVCALVRHHQKPFHFCGSEATAFRISQTARCDLLTILARADALGRNCRDQAELLAQIDLFREFCCEHDCLDHPKSFPSDHSRFLYFRTPGRDQNYLAYDDSKCRVTVMSGLPGAGKDTWISTHLPDTPIVSLDEIRDELGAPPTGNQGTVVQAAREQARVFLRAHRDFVWNATTLSRDIRSQIVDLATAYHAAVRIVYVEAGRDRLFAQNNNRNAVVPAKALEKLMSHWDVPDPAEADEVEWWIDGVRCL